MAMVLNRMEAASGDVLLERLRERGHNQRHGVLRLS